MGTCLTKFEGDQGHLTPDQEMGAPGFKQCLGSKAQTNESIPAYTPSPANNRLGSSDTAYNFGISVKGLGTEEVAMISRMVLFHLCAKARPFGLALVSVGWLLGAILVCRATAQSKDTQRASELAGMKAPDCHVQGWLNSNPVQLKDLLGKVVLVRWWTAGCPFCSATAPSLNAFYEQYHSRGLEVIGFYHHKSNEPLDAERVYRLAKQLRFKFPIAIDHDWQTLRGWWLDGTKANWTSVSFLMDRKGIIQYVHPGGQYVQGDDDHRALKARIEQLLLEK
jgi:peroxiredoxin